MTPAPPAGEVHPCLVPDMAGPPLQPGFPSLPPACVLGAAPWAGHFLHAVPAAAVCLRPVLLSVLPTGGCLMSTIVCVLP